MVDKLKNCTGVDFDRPELSPEREGVGVEPRLKGVGILSIVFFKGREFAPEKSDQPPLLDHPVNFPMTKNPKLCGNAEFFMNSWGDSLAYSRSTPIHPKGVSQGSPGRSCWPQAWQEANHGVGTPNARTEIRYCRLHRGLSVLQHLTAW